MRDWEFSKGLGIVRHASRESLLLRSHREEEKTAEKGPVKCAELTIEDSSYLEVQ